MSKRALIAVAYVVVALVVAYLSGATEFLNLKTLGERAGDLQAFADAHPTGSLALFFCGYALVVALSLPAASLLTLLAGFLFGPILGAAVAALAATSGACVVFLIARTSLGEGLRRSAGPLYTKVADGMQANAFEYLLFLRLVPVFPFFLVNIVPAFFAIRLPTFAAATVIGIVPGSFVYANVGQKLGRVENVKDLVSPPILAALALLGLFALAPVGYRYWRRRTGRSH